MAAWLFHQNATAWHTTSARVAHNRFISYLHPNREEAQDKWKANRPAGDRKNRMRVCKVSARTSRWEWGKLVYFLGKQTIARYLLKHALSFSPALGAFGTGPASLCRYPSPTGSKVAFRNVCSGLNLNFLAKGALNSKSTLYSYWRNDSIVYIWIGVGLNNNSQYYTG